MSYPQSGGYGYGQNPQGAQPPQYGQQYPGGQYGQGYDPQAQYAQQQYAQQQYAQQQYAQQAAYGYGAPPQQQQSKGAGLPANTPTILAAVIGALGVITLFCGFLSGYSPKTDNGEGIALFQTHFILPYGLVVLAGFLALATFLVGTTKHYVAAVAAVATTAAFAAVFQYSSIDPMFAEIGSRGNGALVLLITAILTFVAAAAWLFVESGRLELAPANASDAASQQQGAAQQHAAQQQAAQPQAADYGYAAGYAQQGAAQPSYGYPASAYGTGSQPSAAPSPDAPAPGAVTEDAGATTAFTQPPAEGSANPQTEQQ